MKHYLSAVGGILYFFLIYGLSSYSTMYAGFMQSHETIDMWFSYLNALVLVFVLYGVIGIIEEKIGKSLEKWAKKTKNTYDDILVSILMRFIVLSKYLASLYVGFQMVTIPPSVQSIVDIVFDVVFIVVVLILLTSLINSTFGKVAKSYGTSALSKQMFPIIKKILIVFLWIIGGITIIGNLGYNISALVTGAGIGGIAIALAAQKSLSNVFGAISVLVNQPFKIGETIRINGMIGTISDIGFTYLSLTDLAWHTILIPNENLLSASIENLTERSNRRTDFTIGVTYDTSLVKLREAMAIIEKILEGFVEKWEMDSYRVNFDNFGDFSLGISVTYFSLIDDYSLYLKQKTAINLSIKESFTKAHIDIAFPTQELIIKK